MDEMRLINCSRSDWLSVWCIAFYVDFGHVRIPRNLNVPPSLRMLGIEPQSKLNCEVCASWFLLLFHLLPALATYPYAIKKQRKARNAPSRGHFVSKPLVGGFGCLELVLYGIRELA